MGLGTEALPDFVHESRHLAEMVVDALYNTRLEFGSIALHLSFWRVRSNLLLNTILAEEDAAL